MWWWRAWYAHSMHASCLFARNSQVCAVSVSAASSAFVVTHDLRDARIPNNRRIVDMALFLAERYDRVTLFSAYSDGIAQPFQSALAGTNVRTASISNPPDLSGHSLAFLHLLFWDHRVPAVPAAFAAKLRAASPACRIVVVTDDAHAERDSSRRLRNPAFLPSLPLTAFAAQVHPACLRVCSHALADRLALCHACRAVVCSHSDTCLR